jgi:F0F1-type ATP synthase membrane subunit a
LTLKLGFYFFYFRFNWISATFVFLILPQIFCWEKNQFRLRVVIVSQLLVLELRAVLGRLAAPGTFLIFVSFFFFIIFSNFMGLFPYVFTPSRHLVFTLSLSLPLWLGSVV